jgi:hypothetical protein
MNINLLLHFRSRSYLDGPTDSAGGGLPLAVLALAASALCRCIHLESPAIICLASGPRGKSFVAQVISICRSER